MLSLLVLSRDCSDSGYDKSYLT